MKKRSFLSILLVVVMIATACLFVGCNEEETNKKIDDAVVEAVAQATEKIDTAKAALETAIAAKADTATLTTKIEDPELRPYVSRRPYIWLRSAA